MVLQMAPSFGKTKLAELLSGEFASILRSYQLIKACGTHIRSPF